MRKIVIFFMVLLGTCNMLAQSVFVQKGITFRYNGKNPRTPLGGVYVKTATSPNGVVSDENNGFFFLKLQNIKMGDRLGRATVSKTGLMVFNQQAVDEWSARKEPLKLILCDANQFQKQKNNLISIGRNQAEKKYKKRLAELEKKNKAQQLTLDEYYAKLDSINRDRDNAEKHMEEYADMFARIDESEVDTLAQRAIELFNQGKLEEAIKLFEQGNYLEKLDDALKIKTQAEELRQKADSADVLADKDIEEYKKSIQAQVSAYKMSNEWDKAAELLKGLADKLQTQDVIGDYARFSLTQNLFVEAETYYNIYIKKQLLLSNTNPQIYEYGLAVSYHNLALIYNNTNRLKESEHMYKLALEIRKRLAENNTPRYESDLAQTYNNLANLYEDEQRLIESEQMYELALVIFKRLEETNPQVYEPHLALIYNNLGVLYKRTKQFLKSEQMYSVALEIYKRLVETNPQIVESGLARTYYNLGLLYSDTQRFHESEQMYKYSLEIRKRLAATNPLAYEPDLAKTYSNLGFLYSNTQRFSESEQMYKSGLEIYKRLVETNPQMVESALADSYYNLGLLYSDTQRFSESEQMYKSALKIYQRLAGANPQVYDSDLADSYSNLGLLYSDMQRFAESEQMYNSALEIYKRLMGENAHFYGQRLANCLFLLAELQVKQEKYAEAISPLEKALDFYKKEAEQGKSIDYYTEAMLLLHQLYSQEKKYSRAYQCFKQNIPLLKTLYQSDKSNYIELLNGILVSQSFYSIFEKQYVEAENYSKEALEVDSTKHVAYSNLAAALLFQGKYQEAENIYRQYKSELKEGFLSDFEEFSKAGVIPKNREEDVEKIKQLLLKE